MTEFANMQLRIDVNTASIDSLPWESLHVPPEIVTNKSQELKNFLTIGTFYEGCILLKS